MRSANRSMTDCSAQKTLLETLARAGHVSPVPYGLVKTPPP
jgi:hypothetical protein